MRLNQRAYCIAWTSGAFLALAAAGGVRADVREDFEKLDREMQIAQEEFLDARTEAIVARAAGKLDENAPKPVDHRPAILAKMDALAAQSAETADGAYIAIQTFLWSAGIDVQGALARFRAIVRNFASDPGVEDALGVVELIYKESGSSSDWTDLLSRLAHSTKLDAVRQNALLQAGMIHHDAGRLTEARTTFEELARHAGDTELGKTASAFLFENDHLQVGMVAPDFTAHTFDGKEVTLESLRGKVVLLNFWATWCPNCVAEFAHLKEVFSTLEGQPVELLTVSLDDAKASAARLLAAQKLPGVHTWDQTDRANPVAQKYNIRVLPAWFLLDAEGVIRHRNPYGEKLLPAIRSLLTPHDSPDRPNGT